MDDIAFKAICTEVLTEKISEVRSSIAKIKGDTGSHISCLSVVSGVLEALYSQAYARAGGRLHGNARDIFEKAVDELVVKDRKLKFENGTLLVSLEYNGH